MGIVTSWRGACKQIHGAAGSTAKDTFLTGQFARKAQRFRAIHGHDPVNEAGLGLVFKLPHQKPTMPVRQFLAPDEQADTFRRLRSQSKIAAAAAVPREPESKRYLS